MTNPELSQETMPILEQPSVSPDLISEQSISYSTLNREQAGELGRLLTERLKGIDVQHASTSDSLSTMRAASMTTALLKEALTADPEGFSVVSKYRGPIDMMANAAADMHQYQTGHNLRETFFNISKPDYQQGISVLDAVADKVVDRRWDGTYNPREANAMTANLRRRVMESAVKGLELIAEQRGQALVSPYTAQQVVEYLRNK